MDNLHLKAGSKNVIELHGTAFRVMCLNCDVKISRFALQESLIKLNPSMHALTDKIRPDGDVEISEVSRKRVFRHVFRTHIYIKI